MKSVLSESEELSSKTFVHYSSRSSFSMISPEVLKFDELLFNCYFDLLNW